MLIICTIKSCCTKVPKYRKRLLPLELQHYNMPNTMQRIVGNTNWFLFVATRIYGACITENRVLAIIEVCQKGPRGHSFNHHSIEIGRFDRLQLSRASWCSCRPIVLLKEDGICISRTNMGIRVYRAFNFRNWWDGNFRWLRGCISFNGNKVNWMWMRREIDLKTGFFCCYLKKTNKHSLVVKTAYRSINTTQNSCRCNWQNKQSHVAVITQLHLSRGYSLFVVKTNKTFSRNSIDRPRYVLSISCGFFVIRKTCVKETGALLMDGFCVNHAWGRICWALPQSFEKEIKLMMVVLVFVWTELVAKGKCETLEWNSTVIRNYFVIFFFFRKLKWRREQRRLLGKYLSRYYIMLLC